MSEETKVVKKKKAYDICNRVERKGGKINRFMNFLRVLAAPWIWMVLPFRFYGKKKIKKGAGIFIGNHYKMTDMTYPGTLTWEGIHFLMKKSLFKGKLLTWFFSTLKVIAVSRDGSDVRAVMDSLKCLKNGEKICIYPEGTRNKVNDELQPFKAGAALISIKAKAPIIPVVTYKRPRYFRMTHVIVGDPIEFTELYDKKPTEEELAAADKRLMDTFTQIRAEHKEYLESKKRKRKKA